MAQHRMFSNRIANSAKFLQMPSESQLLYFHMILRSDDDGVVESYPIMKLLGIAPDSFKVLILKGFIQQLNEDQVVVITEWLEHNKIRADRKVDSIYINLLPENIKTIEPKPRSDVKDNSRRIGGQSTVGISKVKLSKVKLIDNTSEQSSAFSIFWEKYPKKEEKKKCLEIWERKKLSSELPRILEFVEKARASDRWKKGFIKQPRTFLNGECWNDDVSAYNDVEKIINNPGITRL